MDHKLAQKIAVVTESTSGVGEVIARKLAGEGAMVVVSGREASAGEKVVESIIEDGGQAMFIRVDLSLATDCDHLIRGTAAYFGGIDILVNNAAIPSRISFEKITDEQWDHEFQVNLRSAFLCIRAVIPYMRDRGGGSIINIDSPTAYARSDVENLQLLAYTCAKSGVLSLTKSLAPVLAAYKIRINLLTVGQTTSPGENAPGSQDIENKTAPMDEIAAGVAYLVSDKASHVTGRELKASVRT